MNGFGDAFWEAALVKRLNEKTKKEKYTIIVCYGGVAMKSVDQRKDWTGILDIRLKWDQNMFATEVSQELIDLGGSCIDNQRQNLELNLTK